MNPASAESQTSFEVIDQATRMEGDRLIGEFQGLRLFSQFQPAFSIPHQRQIGLEATFSGQDPAKPEEGALNSFTIFSRIPAETVVEMDLIRAYIHLANFKAANIDDRWLFLNLHPKIMMTQGTDDIDAFERLLAKSGVKPSQVVVALREHNQVSGDKIIRAVSSLRDLGVLIMFDDFGASSANLDRLWALKPDVVKLKRSFIENALNNKQALRMLNKLVSLIHASGCMVMFEKIETEDEAIIAIETSGDFVEGHFFGVPQPRPVRQNAKYSSSFFGELNQKHNRALQRQTWTLKNELADLTSEFMDCAWAIGDEISMEEAGARLLNRKRVERVYVLDENGIQAGPSLYGNHQDAHRDPKHLPLEDSAGSTFSRRAIFTDAVRHPSIVQTSDPFRSISSMNTCVTLSVTVRIENKTQVLCCDVRWDEGVISVETHGL